jgi:hypothetical protein
MASTTTSTPQVESLPHGMAPRAVTGGSRTRVKVPFAITTMNGERVKPLLWVWARRGRRWIVGQELSLSVANNRKEPVQKDP